MGLKLHEDWGCTPAAIDSCLAVAEKYDIQALFCLLKFLSTSLKLLNTVIGVVLLLF